ncbi:MAG TPA: hypothetical protein VFJ02_07490, partial [Vicinamibacterales bacterium]|nr:hypothetical protein [Vicinamibacterales bacterium]
PLGALLAVRHARGELTDRRYVVGLTAVLVGQFLIFMEVLMSALLCGALALGVAIAVADPRLRGQLYRTAAGAGVALAAHEGGHLLFDAIFDADPGVKKVDFYGIPFFAITHRPDLPRRQEFVIASAGFWVQHGTNEWLLVRRPRLRDERASFAKGMFAFNVGASAAYSVAAFARIGPPERDTRGMAEAARVAEPWIGALILTPAVFDTWRYLDPDARWPVWVSRAAKIGAVLLVLR